jgi:hypothetical protein
MMMSLDFIFCWVQVSGKILWLSSWSHHHQAVVHVCWLSPGTNESDALDAHAIVVLSLHSNSILYRTILE